MKRRGFFSREAESFACAFHGIAALHRLVEHMALIGTMGLVETANRAKDYARLAFRRSSAAIRSALSPRRA